MAELEIYIPCDKCNGEGAVTNNTYDASGNLTSTEIIDPCPKCDGSAEIQWGVAKCDEIDDIMDKCNDIFDKLNE